MVTGISIFSSQFGISLHPASSLVFTNRYCRLFNDRLSIFFGSASCRRTLPDPMDAA